MVTNNRVPTAGRQAHLGTLGKLKSHQKEEEGAGSDPGGQFALPLPRLSRGRGTRQRPVPCARSPEASEGHRPTLEEAGLGRPSSRLAPRGEARRVKQGKNHAQHQIRPPYNVPGRRDQLAGNMPGSGRRTPQCHLEGEPAALRRVGASSSSYPRVPRLCGTEADEKRAERKPEARAGFGASPSVECGSGGRVGPQDRTATSRHSVVPKGWQKGTFLPVRMCPAYEAQGRGTECSPSQALPGSLQFHPTREGMSGVGWGGGVFSPCLYLWWVNPGRPPSHPTGPCPDWQRAWNAAEATRGCGHQSPGKRPKTHTGPTGPKPYSLAPCRQRCHRGRQSRGHCPS